MTTGALSCAFGPCRCAIDAVQAIEREGKVYCSERCIDGRGCDHAHCNCGEWPTAEPDPADVP